MNATSPTATAAVVDSHPVAATATTAAIVQAAPVVGSAPNATVLQAPRDPAIAEAKSDSVWPMLERGARVPAMPHDEGDTSGELRSPQSTEHSSSAPLSLCKGVLCLLFSAIDTTGSAMMIAYLMSW